MFVDVCVSSIPILLLTATGKLIGFRCYRHENGVFYEILMAVEVGFCLPLSSFLLSNSIGLESNTQVLFSPAR